MPAAASHHEFKHGNTDDNVRAARQGANYGYRYANSKVAPHSSSTQDYNSNDRDTTSQQLKYPGKMYESHPEFSDAGNGKDDRVHSDNYGSPIDTNGYGHLPPELRSDGDHQHSGHDGHNQVKKDYDVPAEESVEDVYSDGDPDYYYDDVGDRPQGDDGDRDRDYGDYDGDDDDDDYSESQEKPLTSSNESYSQGQGPELTEEEAAIKEHESDAFHKSKEMEAGVNERDQNTNTH